MGIVPSDDQFGFDVVIQRVKADPTNRFARASTSWADGDYLMLRDGEFILRTAKDQEFIFLPLTSGMLATDWFLVF